MEQNNNLPEFNNQVEDKIQAAMNTPADVGVSSASSQPLEHTDEPPQLRGSEEITAKQREDYMQESIVQPVPAQNQLPADSYLYANTTSIGGLIQNVADEYSLDPHKLEALTNIIRNKKVNLAGFYNMQIGYYPGMSAESLVTALGRVADLSNTVSERERQEAEMRGEKYTSNGFDKLVDSLQSIDGKKSGKVYFMEALAALQEADHIKFDTQTLTEYYETLVQSGVSKGDAWTRTMAKQDEFRAAQDNRAVKQDFDSLITPDQMSSYVAALYTKVQQTSDPEARLRLYGQYQTAAQLAKTYTEAYKADPAAYLQNKDPSFQGLLNNAQQSGDFSDVVANLDAHYNRLGVPESQRKYLTKEQLQSVTKEINTFLGADPIKAQSVIVGLNQSYGKNAGKVINQLIAEGHVGSEAKVLIEAIKTGSPAYNEDVLNMLKNKLAYKGNYAKEMLGAPDVSTAQTMRQKIEAKVYGTPGYKALVNQLDLAGNITGKIEMAQYFADMAIYYKSKNPGLSDKKAVEMVQKNLIDTVYSYDADNRVILQKRTLDGRPILYGKNAYTVEQATNYLSNRKFTGQGIQVGNLSLENSERLLRDESKITYRTIDQFTVQPIYSDNNGTVQSLFVGKGANRKVLTLNLKDLGNEDIIGVIDARDSVRKLTSLLTEAANIPSPSAMRYAGPLSDNQGNAMKVLVDLGFDLRNFDTTKPFNEQFDRTRMEPKRLEALTNMTIKQQLFEQKLNEYEKLKKAQRDAASPRIHTLQLFNPWQEVVYAPGEKARWNMSKKLSYYLKEAEDLKPELKRSRNELYKLEEDILKDAAIFLNYKGNLPVKPLTKQINKHAALDAVLWGGY